MTPKRKLQVSNGHYLMFDQLARLVIAIRSSDGSRKIGMSYLEEKTGLPFRQVRNRVSIGRAMGVFEERAVRLTPFGALVAEYDTFFEDKTTLEYVHYLAAGNFKNLVWCEVFNTILPDKPPTDYQGWLQHFRSSLAGQYTEHSLKDHLPKEVHFVIDAYTEKNLNRLDLLHKSPDGTLFRRRHTNIEPLAFSTMLYDWAEEHRAKLVQVSDMQITSGSPGRLFGLEQADLRKALEGLHEKGWVRYESTHNLEQIRLKPDFSALDFLKAYYERREPQPKIETRPTRGS